MFFKGYKTGFVLLIVGLFLQSCAFGGGGAPAAPEPVTLKVATLPYLSFAPFFIAQEEGYYTEQGLEVEFVELVNNQDIIPTVSQGEVDVSSGLVTVGIFNTMARGGNIKIVADKGYVDPAACDSIALVARKSLVEDGQLNDPSQIKGRLINVVPTSWLEFYLEQLLAAANLTIDDVKLTSIPVPAQIEALDQGTLDMTAQNEPWVRRLTDMGHQPVLTPLNQLLPNAQYAITLYGPNLLEKNPEAGQRFMVAYLKAVRQYNQGKTERNIEILAKYTGLDKEVLNQICWSTLRDDGQIDTQSVLDFQNWAVNKGLLDTVVSADKFWDPGFAEQANTLLNESASN